MLIFALFLFVLIVSVAAFSPPSFLPWRQVRLHFQAPMERSRVFDFDSYILITGVWVNESLIDFVADEERLDSPHGNHELNELAYEHGQHPNR